MTEMKDKFKVQPHIWIHKIDDWCYWYKYEVCDWTNTFHTYEGCSNSREELAKDIGEEITRHVLEDGSLYGL